MTHSSTRVVIGVDTHADTHTAAVVDELGRRQDEIQVATTPAGHRELLAWALQHGQIIAFGVEGSGSWGATLARYLTAQGHQVREIPRPNRQERRRHGKSDVLDAEAAARAVLSGTTSAAKPGTGTVEMIRALRVARRSAASMRTNALNQMRGLVVNAPQQLREQLRGQPVSTLVQRCVSFRPGRPETTTSATKLALRSLARRIAGLDAELTALDAELARLTTQAAPALLALPGVGPDVAGALLTVAGSEPTRVPSEAAFARLCGVAPLPASSGRTDRHRLNRGGDRQANNALWRIVICRIRARHHPTVAYLERRAAEGLSKREIIRCLKRYVARETFTAIRTSQPA